MAINWPNFNAVVFQGIGRLKERGERREERGEEREQPVPGAVRTHTLIN